MLNFPGNYTDYRDYLAERETEAALEAEEKAAKAARAAAKAAPAAAPTPAPAAPAKRRASFAEKKEFEQLEKDIAALEKEKEQLVANLATGQGSRQELIDWPARLQAVDKDLDAKGERWLELSEWI